MSARGFWVAFTVGLAAGAVVALLYAPQSGAKTRKKLKGAYDEAGEYVDDAGDYLQDQAERLAKQSKKLYKQGVDAADDALSSATDSVNDTLAAAKGKAADAVSSVKDKAGDYADTAVGYGKKVRSMV